MGEVLADRFRKLPQTSLLGFDVRVADSPAARLLGLAFVDAAEAPQGLLIPRCRSVHTLGMRFPLDLVFLDQSGVVVELRREVPPRRVARCRRAAAVLELPAPGSAPPS